MCRYNRDNEQVFYASTSFDAAFKEAKATKGMPTAIIAHTVKGKGVSFMENQVGDETRLKVQLNLCEQPSDTSEVVRFYLYRQ